MQAHGQSHLDALNAAVAVCENCLPTCLQDDDVQAFILLPKPLP